MAVVHYSRYYWESPHFRCWDGISGAGMAFQELGWHFRSWDGISGAGMAFQVLGLDFRCWDGISGAGIHVVSSFQLMRLLYKYILQRYNVIIMPRKICIFNIHIIIG